MRKLLPRLVALCLPGPGLAHPGSGLVHGAEDFTLGLSLSLGVAESLLPLLVLGLALAGRTPLPWLLLACGTGAGLVLSPIAPEGTGIAALGLAVLLIAGLALRGPPLPRLIRLTMALLIPALALASLYRGGSADPPGPMILGSVMGGCLLIILPALGGTAILRLPGKLPPLVLRIAASWVAAVLIIMLALALTGSASGP